MSHLIRLPDEVRTDGGRMPGTRARKKRARYLNCLRELLDESRYRDITVADLARRAGGVPGTFYQYFPDIEAAILALAMETAEEGAQLREKLTPAVAGEAKLYDAIAGLVDAYYEFWDKNEAILRVIDLAAMEGDERFRAIRVKMLNTVTLAIAKISEAHIPASQRQVDPVAMAGTITGMLAHIAAHQDGFESWGIRGSDVRHSLTRLAYWGITGDEPPARG